MVFNDAGNSPDIVVRKTKKRARRDDAAEPSDPTELLDRRLHFWRADGEAGVRCLPVDVLCHLPRLLQNPVWESRARLLLALERPGRQRLPGLTVWPSLILESALRGLDQQLSNLKKCGAQASGLLHQLVERALGSSEVESGGENAQIGRLFSTRLEIAFISGAFGGFGRFSTDFCSASPIWPGKSDSFEVTAARTCVARRAPGA